MRNSKPFEGLPVERAGQEVICGVVAVEAATGQVVGTLRYTGGCTEIHDIQIAAGVRHLRHLGISGYDTETHKLAIDLPDFGLWLDPPPPEESEQADQSQTAADRPVAFRR